MKEPKKPIKLKISFLDTENELVYGKIIFRNSHYDLLIKTSKNNELFNIPFNIIGIMNEPHLVRFSGETGAYTEFRPNFQKSEKVIEIESTILLNDLIGSIKKYDTIEIFVN
mgnify:FL=1|tara:strand:+ start:1754 stop:2089 length:336 start_codon:yes stop_codon:yes gene_type:complete